MFTISILPHKRRVQRAGMDLTGVRGRIMSLRRVVYDALRRRRKFRPANQLAFLGARRALSVSNVASAR